MKILLVCQYYYPEPFRINDVAEGLVGMGHEVTVLTGVPNYPMGEFYDGYKKKQKREENINGVKVYRTFTIARRRGVFFRFLNYYSFAFSSSKFIKKLPNDFDVILTGALSPIMMACAALKYKKKYGKKIVLLCYDLWPESLTAGGVKKNSLIFKHYKKVSEKIYKSADIILNTSKMFKNYFSREFGIENTHYLPQYAEKIFLPEKCSKKPDGYIDLMFAGNIGGVQSVETILFAAEQLKDNKKIRFHIVGDGSDYRRLLEMLSAMRLENVFFYGRKPLSEMQKFYSMADAMLVTMIKSDVLSLTLPGKIQTYMAAGKPIIGAIDGETAGVIEESGCGFCGGAEDADGLVLSINSFIRYYKAHDGDLSELQKRATDYYEKYFSREAFFDNLETYLEEAAR